MFEDTAIGVLLKWFVKEVEKALNKNPIPYQKEFTFIFSPEELIIEDLRLVSITSPCFDEDEEISVDLDVSYKDPQYPTLRLEDYLEIKAVLYPYEKQFQYCEEIQGYVNEETFGKIREWVTAAVDFINRTIKNLQRDVEISSNLESFGYVDEYGNFYPITSFRNITLIRKSTKEVETITDVYQPTNTEKVPHKTLVMCPFCKEAKKLPAEAVLITKAPLNSLKPDEFFGEPSSLFDGTVCCINCGAELSLDNVYVYRDGKFVSFKSKTPLDDPDILTCLA